MKTIRFEHREELIEAGSEAVDCMKAQEATEEQHKGKRRNRQSHVLRQGGSMDGIETLLDYGASRPG